MKRVYKRICECLNINYTNQAIILSKNENEKKKLKFYKQTYMSLSIYRLTYIDKKKLISNT